MTSLPYLAGLISTVEALSSLARQPAQALERPVPACPDWTLDELFGHIGYVERWTAQVLRTGKPDDGPTPPPSSGAEWFLAGIPEFLEAMHGVDPEAPCWNFGPPPRTAGFWLRRQAHEHAIHLVDAFAASALEPPKFSNDFLLDGVDEVLSILTPRQIRLNRMKAPEKAVTFQTSANGSWTLGEGAVAANITASAEDLYLGLWGRSVLAATAVVDGDLELAGRTMAGALTP